MFNSSKKKIEELKSQLEIYDQKYQCLLKSREEWRELAVNAKHESNAGNLLVDWSKVNVISIERAPLDRGQIDGTWVTNVSYWRDEVESGLPIKKFKEMIFYTNKKQHDGLIDTYNKYLMNKEKKKK